MKKDATRCARAREYRENAKTIMDQIPSHETFQFLHQAGWTQAEMDRLSQFCRTYQMSDLDQPSLGLRRLEFVRWLVATGRLTDQFPETMEHVAPRLNEDTAYLRGVLPAR